MRLICSGAAAAVILASVLTGTGCNSCPFQVLQRQAFQGSVAPGAFRTHDVVVADEDSLEVDVSVAGLGTGLVYAWLTAPDCQQLFDGPYPGPGSGAPAARCSVIVGPVSPGTVSGRMKVAAGSFRLFVYATSANSGDTAYNAEVGRWGRTCRAIFATQF